ncbi:MAG: ATP-grasp domain-containing protein [bacterium]|nr:ATP-grasp domain-containing protein [bacterium]
MRICLLTYQDLDADPFPEDDFPCDPRPFLPDAEWHLEILEPGESQVERLEAVIAQGFDVYFNLCDGDGKDFPGIDAVRILEEHGVAFTGPGSAHFDPTRRQMKDACRRLGIATPRDVVVRDESDCKKVLERLRFPMIVKSYASFASVDLSRHSRVQSEQGLRRQVRKMLSRHKAVLVEEFIEGVECTVLVAETPGAPDRPTTYTPVQYRFPEGECFKHERLKWLDCADLTATPVEDPALDARLRDEAVRFFLEFGGTGFARTDVRVAESGTPYTLEINPLPGIYFEEKDYGGADQCLSFDPAGHVGFTRQLVAAALARSGR